MYIMYINYERALCYVCYVFVLKCKKDKNAYLSMSIAVGTKGLFVTLNCTAPATG